VRPLQEQNKVIDLVQWNFLHRARSLKNIAGLCRAVKRQVDFVAQT